MKQLEGVGPDGEVIIDYSIHDAVAAGFNKIVFILRREIFADFTDVIGDRMEGVFRELGVKAIQAGVDIAMICHEYEHQQEVYLGILDAVKNGVISEERINESVKRIVRTKLRYLK